MNISPVSNRIKVMINILIILVIVMFSARILLQPPKFEVECRTNFVPITTLTAWIMQQ